MPMKASGHLSNVFLGMPKLLAIDYGLARCGIAITDDLQIIASGLTAVPTREIWAFLHELFKTEEIETVVVGDPSDLFGKETHATNPANEFCEELGKKFPSISIARVDETYTSKMAMDAMIQGGMKKSKRREKGMVDMVSATIILQSYMDSLSA